MPSFRTRSRIRRPGNEDVGPIRRALAWGQRTRGLEAGGLDRVLRSTMGWKWATSWWSRRAARNWDSSCRSRMTLVHGRLEYGDGVVGAAARAPHGVVGVTHEVFGVLEAAAAQGHADARLGIEDVPVEFGALGEVGLR